MTGKDMLMRFNIFFFFFFLNQSLYAQDCIDKEYIKYNSVNFNLVFVHKGFVSPQIIDPKTGKGECEISRETHLYNKSIEPNQSILIIDGVTGIQEYGSNIIAISTFAGAHNGRLYFFARHIINRNSYPLKYTLESIKLENGSNFFTSDMSSISVCEHIEEKGEKNSIIEVTIYEPSKDRKNLAFEKYRLSHKTMSFILVAKQGIVSK